MDDFDSPWKEALEEYFEAFLAFLFAHVHAAVDWPPKFEFLDKELQQIVREAEHGRRYVDKLARVWLKNGREGWILIHVEVQAAEEADFAERMYVYNYRLFDRYNRKVVSLAILADERPGWRPDQYGYNLLGCSVDFRFPTAKLLEYASDLPALERDVNPFATVVLAHLKTRETRGAPDARLSAKTQLVKALFDKGLGAEDVRRLFRFIDWIMALPKPLGKVFWQEITQFQEERQMPFITTPQRIGREEGLMMGRLEHIETLLEDKFGPEGVQLMPEVRRITDVDALGVLRDRLRKAATLDDFRQLLTAAVAVAQSASAGA